MIVKFDELNRFETPNITLCFPDSTYSDDKVTRPIGKIVNVKNLSIDYNFNTYSQGSFECVRTNDFSGNIFDLVQKRMYLFIENLGFCVISNVTNDYSNKSYKKQVEFYTCDKELENFEAPYLIGDDESITLPFFAPGEDCIVNRIADICYGWDFNELTDMFDLPDNKPKIGTFTEVTANNMFEFIFNDVQDVYDCIVDCDYIQRKFNVYSKKKYAELHKTDINISNNLYNSITDNENIEDDYSALIVQGENDLDIKSVNPVGNNLVYNFSSYKPWMTSELEEAVDKWENNISQTKDVYKELNKVYLQANSDYSNHLQDYEALLQKTETDRQAFINSYNYYNSQPSMTQEALEQAIADVRETFEMDIFGGMVKVCYSKDTYRYNDGFAKVIVDKKEVENLDFEKDFYFQLDSDGESYHLVSTVSGFEYDSNKDLYTYLDEPDWDLLYFSYNHNGTTYFWKENDMRSYYHLFLSNKGYEYSSTQFIRHFYANVSTGDKLNVYQFKSGIIHYGGFWDETKSKVSTLNVFSYTLSYTQSFYGCKFRRFYNAYCCYSFSISIMKEYTVPKRLYEYIVTWEEEFSSMLTFKTYGECIISQFKSYDIFDRLTREYEVKYIASDLSNQILDVNLLSLKYMIDIIQNNCGLTTESKTMAFNYGTVEQTIGEKDITQESAPELKVPIFNFFDFTSTESSVYIFTDELLRQLNCYLFTGEYTYNNLTLTDNMTFEEKINTAAELMDKATSKLNTIVNNLKKFSIDVKSFIFDLAFVNFTAQLCSGCTITVETSENQFEEIYLTNFSINYDDKTLSFTLGNRYNKFDIKSLFDEVLGDISKSTSQIERLKQRVYKLEQANKNK